MSVPNVILRVLYLSMIVIGVLGNSFLIFLYSFMFNTSQKTRSRFLILIIFLFTNIMLIIFRGIPRTLDVWELKYFVDTTGNRFLAYFQRVTRSLSLCSSFHLVLFQAITISPNSLIKTELKSKAFKGIFYFCLVSYVFNLLIDTILPVYIMGLRNKTQTKEESNNGFRSLDLDAKKTKMFLIWKIFHDGFYVCFMGLASVYIAIFLCRHHLQLEYLHITTQCRRASREIHAATAMLLLGSAFFIFTLMNSIFEMYMSFSKDSRPLIHQISVFLSLCFQTMSPFILLKSDSRIFICFCAHWQMQSPSSLQFKM